MRTKKFFYNSMTTAFYQLIVMVTGFILPKVMLTYFGSEINGLVSSITQLIAYLTLVESGLSGATVYSLYKPLANNDKNEINSILSAARIFYNKIGYVFLSLSVGLAFVYPLFIKTDLLTYFEVFFLFLILAINGVLEFFTLAKYRALLTADQKTYVISLASIVQVILNVIIISTLSIVGFSIVLTRLIAIGAILARTIILWSYCKYKYDFIDFSVKADFTSLNRRWDALFMQIVGIVHRGSPVLLATILLTLNHVSIYSIYYVVIAGINALLSIFISGLSAGFGDLLARGDKNRFKRAFKQFEYSYYIILTIVYSIMMVTYIPFIKIYTDGADINYIFPLLAVVMTIDGYLYNLKTPFGMLTISTGKYRESRVQISIQVIMQVVLGILLGKLYGLIGIMVAAAISNLYRDINFIFFAPKHLTHYSFKESLHMWIRSIIVFAIVVFIGTKIPNSSITTYFMWVKYAITIALISTIVTVSTNFILDKNSFLGVFNRLKLIFIKG